MKNEEQTINEIRSLEFLVLISFVQMFLLLKVPLRLRVAASAEQGLGDLGVSKDMASTKGLQWLKKCLYPLHR